VGQRRYLRGNFFYEAPGQIIFFRFRFSFPFLLVSPPSVHKLHGIFIYFMGIFFGSEVNFVPGSVQKRLQRRQGCIYVEQ
jgi:hypothetical protein